jgi:hypothetical protein
MLEIRRKKLLCREFWFDEPWSPGDASLLLFYHWKTPVEGAVSQPTPSLKIDLHLPEADIWTKFSGSTRNQINRAEREGLVFRQWVNPDTGTLDRFFDFLRQFASERGMPEEPPLWMREYAIQNSLTLTCASSPESGELAWHSYYHDSEWVRQLQSISLFATSEDKAKRNLIARANRFLHWMDMREFRNRGIRNFDFGGWYSGSQDEKLLRINAFKEEFGGERTERYHSMLAVTLAGNLFLAARRNLRGNESLLHVV